MLVALPRYIRIGTAPAGLLVRSSWLRNSSGALLSAEFILRYSKRMPLSGGNDLVKEVCK